MSSLTSMQSTIRGLCDAIENLDPPIKPRLRSGTSDDEIQAAEASLGLAIPNDLKNFLLCHNGQEFYEATSGYGDPLVPMMRQPANGQGYSHYWLGGVADIVEQTGYYRDDIDCFSPEHFETFGPVRYHDKFIVFTNTENADTLAIDLLPQPGGIVGQVVVMSTQVPQLIVVSPSLEMFLQSLASDYANNRFRHSPCEYFVSYVEASSEAVFESDE
jgi:cell wall assembly regulator SMI1